MTGIFSPAIVLIGLTILLVSSPGAAQSVPLHQTTSAGTVVTTGNAAQSDPAPNEFGVQSEFIHNVNASDFRRGSAAGAGEMVLAGDFYVQPGLDSSAAVIIAPVHLPSGTLVTGMTVYYFDNHPTLDPEFAMFMRTPPDGGTPAGHGAVLASGQPGWTSVTAAFTERIDNAAWHYSFQMKLNRDPGTFVGHRLARVAVRYKREVRSAPSTATFADVPVGHPFHRFIEALAAAGITAGCGGGNFCPNEPISRGQMAVFLSAALGLHWAP